MPSCVSLSTCGACSTSHNDSRRSNMVPAFAQNLYKVMFGTTKCLRGLQSNFLSKEYFLTSFACGGGGDTRRALLGIT